MPSVGVGIGVTAIRVIRYVIGWSIAARDRSVEVVSFPSMSIPTWSISPGDGNATINSYPRA